MGQAMSLSELEDCVRRGFSDRVLVSHGLFRSPYPRGTHVKCEVDLAEVPTLTEWKEDDLELVVQIVKCTEISCKREWSNEAGKFGNRNDHANADITREHPSPSAVIGTQGDLNSFQDFTDSPKGVTFSSTELLGAHKNISDAPVLSEGVSPESSLHIDRELQNFGSVVSRLISILAPHISLEDASFDAILNLLHRSCVVNREDGVSCFSHQASFIEDCKSGSENLVDSEKSVSLFQSTKGKSTHGNIVPMLGACKGHDILFLFYPPAPFTLESVLHFSPKVLEDDWDIRFLVYQLLSGIAFCHDHGIVHGDLKPSNVLLTDMLWCWITGFHVDSLGSRRKWFPDPRCNHLNSGVHKDVVAKDLVETDLDNWQSAFMMWWQGELSNYDYLLILNRLAGRRWGDRKFHTVMPWVIDFSARPDEISDRGWRDLTKSKWRLAKGDEQLDFTYATAEIPHHVSDECLSELAVCIYKARRLPLFVLRQTVRSVYEPNEYPVSLQRLYQWTPDDCIPEFYSDASVFSSVHMGMSDLAVPSWAKNAKDFIFWHREALEGDHVSNHLHHWIDLTFGYKLSGEASVGAKNVTLSAANPVLPRSQGRCQLFTLPHPKRQRATMCHAYRYKDGKQAEISPVDTDIRKATSCMTAPPLQTRQSNNPGVKPRSDCSTVSLESLEEAALFCGNSRHLSPIYKSGTDSAAEPMQARGTFGITETLSLTSMNDLPSRSKHKIAGFDQKSLAELLEALEVKRNSDTNYQDYLLWQSKETHYTTSPEGAACDIFALGCLVAEIYRGRPLFDLVSLRDFEEHGVEPSLIQQLPVHVQDLVRSMVESNPVRLSAAQLLESPFFPPTVVAVHSFVSMLYLFEDQISRLEFVARLASHRAFLLMGSLAAKKCISFCLSPLVLPPKNIPVQACITFLNGSLMALKPHDAKLLLLPVIQKLLQGQGNCDLKVALLQGSFISEIFKSVGIALYLQHVHQTILSILQQSVEDGPVAAASSVLIETCRELGVPITCCQTIVPLLQQFGRDVTISTIDTVVGIGKQLGECMIVKHLLPSLRAMIIACLHSVSKEKKGPAKSWRMLVMHDTVMVLERLLYSLSPTTVFMELVQEPHNVLESLLLHPAIKNSLQQHAAKALLSVCQCIGPDATAAYVLPRLQPLFAVLAFDASSASKDDSRIHSSISSFASLKNRSRQAEPSIDHGFRGLSDADSSHDSNPLEKLKVQMDLVHCLYSGLASLLGIERLRQCLSTWLILEQLLLKLYSWKWEMGARAYQGNAEKKASANQRNPKPAAEFSPTSLLLNEIGWSVPQPLSNKTKILNGEENSKQLKAGSEARRDDDHEPWMWVPSSEDAWEGTEYLNRPGLVFGTGKDERPLKMKATVSHSWRAHPGPIKAVAVGDGEDTIFTAGVGTKMKGLVKQWQLSTTQSIMEYTGHEEAVNDICVLPWTRKIASCDGTIHLWDIQTGERIAVFSESIGSSRSFSSAQVENSRVPNVGIVGTSGTALSSGMLSTGLHGSHYTCMHLMEMEERLVAGTGNGHARFFDLPSGQCLHLWRCDLELSGSSLVSAITSSGKQSHIDGGRAMSSSWIAMGFNLGHCRLLDLRAGNFVASWRAHEGFITKLAAFEEHYLISSSLDKTLCLWDLRRNVPAQVCAFQGHTHGVSSFALWSSNLLSAGGNKIGLSSLSHLAPQNVQGQDWWQAVKCHKLFSTDLSNLNLSSITAISVLPFSRFFLVGTDDGYLRVCK